MNATLRFALWFASIGVAVYAIAAYAFVAPGALVDPSMRASFEAHAGAIRSHAFAASLALLLGPAQLSPRLRARRPRLHRWLGRIYLGLGVGVGGVAGLFMATHAAGGTWARLGFGALAVAWLFTGARAYAAARARSFVEHRRWMVRNFALTFAAVTLRIYVASSIVGGIAFATAYPAIAWLCWVPNLVVAELLFNRPTRVAIGVVR
ncbi:MAG TPA: DUF2306 domain-containing protein [Caldimonas sp.]|jgi:hypothetical protein